MEKKMFILVDLCEDDRENQYTDLFEVAFDKTEEKLLKQAQELGHYYHSQLAIYSADTLDVTFKKDLKLICKQANPFDTEWVYPEK